MDVSFLYLTSFFHFIAQIYLFFSDFLTNNYRKEVHYWVFAIILGVILFLLIYSKVSEKPFLVRICIHLIIVLYVLKWLKLEDRRSY